MQPWMKYTGVSLPAAVITWFRVPKEQRRYAMTGAIAAVSVVLALFAALFVIWFLFHWIRG